MYSDYDHPSEDVFKKISALAQTEQIGHPIDPQEVIINDVDIQGGSAIGENFTSVLKRFTIHSTVKDANQAYVHKVVGKFLPLNASTTKWWKSMRVFDREALMYNQILINYENESKTPFAPRLYHSSDSCILLEDLSSSGYVLNDARKGLNLPQMQAILLKLGSFHAYGHHLIQSMGFERFHSKFGVISDVAHHGPALTKDPKVTLEFRAIFKGMVKLSLKLLESEYDAQVYQDLCEIMAKVEEDYGAVRKPLDHHFQVIGHGDLWNNNVLFQTDQTDPLVIADVKFIDFQNSMRTRPTMDLVHLFYQSTTPDLRKDHLNALLKLYHSELLLNLEMRGISPRVYPEEQFHQDFKNCFIHGLYMGFVNIQAIFNAEEVINKVVLEKENDPIGPSLTLKAKEVMLQRLTGLVKEAQEFEVIRFK